MQFEITLRASEAIVALKLEAVDEQDARAQAGAQGYRVLAVRRGQPWRTWLGTRRGHFPLMLFNQQFLALIDSVIRDSRNARRVSSSSREQEMLP